MQPYRPSNGTEGAYFQEARCGSCVKEPVTAKQSDALPWRKYLSLSADPRQLRACAPNGDGLESQRVPRLFAIWPESVQAG